MDHRHLRRLALATAVAGVAGVAAAPAAHAVTWLPTASGTTAEITAIDYQSPTKLWFTTATGAIFTRQADGNFSQTRTPSAVRLNDVEFDSTGTVGYAVGDGAQVLRSTNGGASWTAISGILASKKAGGCNAAPEALGNVNHLTWAGDDQVWLFGEGSQLLASVNPKAGSPTFVDENRKLDGTPGVFTDDVCRIRGDIYQDAGQADGYFPAPGVGTVLAGFYTTWYSPTALDRTTDFLKRGSAANSYNGRAVLAGGDPGNPSRMWTTDPNAYGRSQTGWTEDGWTTKNLWSVPDTRAFPDTGPYDVDFSGGTVLAAGDGGAIYASTDGRNFSYVDAPAFPTASWRAVGLASATQGAVGGVNGTLLLTGDANALPVPPTAGGGGTTTPPKTGGGGTTTPPKTTLPSPTLASASKPPITGKAAKILGKYVVFKVKGKLGLPRGLSRSAACKGTMSVSVYKGKKRLKNTTVKVDSKCGYKTTVKVKRSKVGRKTKKLKLKVAFRGNSVLGKLSSTYNVKVKK